jgi:hypothetical protein
MALFNSLRRNDLGKEYSIGEKRLSIVLGFVDGMLGALPHGSYGYLCNGYTKIYRIHFFNSI